MHIFVIKYAFADVKFYRDEKKSEYWADDIIETKWNISGMKNRPQCLKQ